MQDNPLLEQLDWFFTFGKWISSYPDTQVLPLARTASDHVPCVVTISTNIPRCHLFRFENYWVELDGFMECVSKSWRKPSRKSHVSAIIADKLKTSRQELKKWQLGLSRMKLLIEKCSKVIVLLDELEELRPLFRPEFNFRKIVKLHLEKLLHLHLYWKKRCTIRWIKVWEENTQFFQAMATERYRRNSIASIKLDDGSVVTDHVQMAEVFFGLLSRTEWDMQGALIWFLTSLP